MKPVHLCDKHEREGRPEPVRTCTVCQRLQVERDIVTRTVDALLAAGYSLDTDEGDHRFYGASNPSRDRETILARLMEVDDEHLGTFDASEATGTARGVKPSGYVYFVYGNDGYDVISDYTMNLETALEPVNAYAESLS